MNSLLLALINILRCAATFGHNQGALTIIPPKQILHNIFAELLPQPQIDRLSERLLLVVEGRSNSLVGLDMLESQITRRNDLEGRLNRANMALNELIAIKGAMFSGLTHHADIVINNANVLRYIQEFYIASDQGEPDFVLIGAIPPDLSPLQVRLNRNRAFLRKIDVIYSANSAYPLLNLRVGSSSANADWTSERKNMIQKADPDDDLRLSMRSAILGEIYTRPVESLYTIEGKKTRLTIQHLPEEQLFLTTIADEKGRSLITCLRASTA